MSTFVFNYDYSIGFLAGWGAHPLDILVWILKDKVAGIYTCEGTGQFWAPGGLYNNILSWDVNFKYKNVTSKTFLKKPTDYKYVRFTSFNTFGFETENIRYNNGSDVLDRRIRNYDSNGNRVLSSFYDSIGELTLKVVEKYDMNGNKINILIYGRIGKLYSKETVFRQTQILLQAKGCT